MMAELLLAVMDRAELGSRGRHWAVMGAFLLVWWVSLGVEELLEKTDMMLDKLPMPRITGV